MRVGYAHVKVCLSYYGGTQAEGVQGQVARKYLGLRRIQQ